MTPTTDDPTRLAFVCVRNAGRSQMAAAFAERERDRRDLDVEILQGGTDPADAVHGVVVDAMAEVGVDVAGRTPREADLDELRRCDRVATMGCSTLDVAAIREDTDVRDWALDDPGGRDLAAVREIRDEVERRVVALVDEVAPTG
jgi:arsenate reductase